MTPLSPPKPPWHEIDTVLLDLDGTLLDLHYDNYFFGTYLPAQLAAIRGADEAVVRAEFEQLCAAVEGTLDWYCLDYWQHELDVDLLQLKRSVAHLVRWRRHAPAFLQALAAADKRRILATNAHPAGLAIKAERVPFTAHLDASYSAHDIGAAKEQAEFWSRLQARADFDPARTLFIDDNPRVLTAARAWGIQHLLGITRPDSSRPASPMAAFVAVEDFDRLAPPVGRAAPVGTQKES